jgi:DNA replicative helicase MCM subunit Mcm2 (Cdc46/Mcm family)
LNTRTSIFAACNPLTPGQRYNSEKGKNIVLFQDLYFNTGISTPLLSRFDLIFVIRDYCNVINDNETCDFILQKFMNEEHIKDKNEELLWPLERL